MSILGEIISALLKPILQYKANKIVNSEEYQNSMKQMTRSTDELNK